MPIGNARSRRRRGRRPIVASITTTSTTTLKVTEWATAAPPNGASIRSGRIEPSSKRR